MRRKLAASASDCGARKFAALPLMREEGLRSASTESIFYEHPKKILR